MNHQTPGDWNTDACLAYRSIMRSVRSEIAPIDHAAFQPPVRCGHDVLGRDFLTVPATIMLTQKGFSLLLSPGTRLWAILAIDAESFPTWADVMRRRSSPICVLKGDYREVSPTARVRLARPRRDSQWAIKRKRGDQS
jgi:hypothetical protein